MTTRKKNYRRRSSSRKKRHQNAGSSIPSDRMKQLALIMIELIGPKKSQELGYRMMTPQSSTPRLKDNPSGGGDSASESENTFSDDQVEKMYNVLTRHTSLSDRLRLSQMLIVLSQYVGQKMATRSQNQSGGVDPLIKMHSHKKKTIHRPSRLDYDLLDSRDFIKGVDVRPVDCAKDHRHRKPPPYPSPTQDYQQRLKKSKCDGPQTVVYNGTKFKVCRGNRDHRLFYGSMFPRRDLGYGANCPFCIGREPFEMIPQKKERKYVPKKLTALEIYNELLAIFEETLETNLSKWLKSQQTTLQEIWNVFVPTNRYESRQLQLGDICIFSFNHRAQQEFLHQPWTGWRELFPKLPQYVTTQRVKPLLLEYLKSKATSPNSTMPESFKAHISNRLSLSRLASQTVLKNLKNSRVQKYLNYRDSTEGSAKKKRTWYGQSTDSTDIVASGNRAIQRGFKTGLTYISPEVFMSLFSEWHLLQNHNGENFERSLQTPELLNDQLDGMADVRYSLDDTKREEHGLTTSEEFYLLARSSKPYLRLLHPNHQTFGNLCRIAYSLDPVGITRGLLITERPDGVSGYDIKPFLSSQRWVKKLRRPVWEDGSGLSGNPTGHLGY